MEIPSNIVDIPMHIHARVFASVLSDNAIIMANMNSNPHNQMISRHRGCCLLFVQYIINPIHLAKAQIAKIRIIIVHTSWECEKISQNQIKASINPQIQSNHTIELTLFFNALIMADIPEINKKNPNIISINFQNMLGDIIVIIQNIIITIESPIISEYGRDCMYFLFHILTLKNKVKLYEI